MFQLSDPLKTKIFILIILLLSSFAIYQYQNMDVLFDVGMGALLAYITVCDMRKRMIPNRSVLMMLFITLVYLSLKLEIAMSHILTSLMVLILFILIYFVSKKQVGMGDIKLLGAMGLFLGPEKIITCIFASTLLAGCYSLVGLATKKLESKTELPFMPFILIGYYYVILI